MKLKLYLYSFTACESGAVKIKNYNADPTETGKDYRKV
jgi:hypothetical protein